MATEVDEALYDALEAGDPDAVRRALAAGADPDGEHYNESPLTFLCRHAARGDTFVATEGANPGDPVACLAALLEYAASPNIAAGADVNARDSEGKTPLTASIDENEMAGADISCVYSALLRAGATLPPYVPDDEGDEEDPYLHKVRRAGGFRQYEAQVTKSLAAIFEPKFPKLPAEVIPTIVAFWAHVGDY